MVDATAADLADDIADARLIQAVQAASDATDAALEADSAVAAYRLKVSEDQTKVTELTKAYNDAVVAANAIEAEEVKAEDLVDITAEAAAAAADNLEEAQDALSEYKDKHPNNGFGNGDQTAPGNSGSNNNAENSSHDGGKGNRGGDKSDDDDSASLEQAVRDAQATADAATKVAADAVAAYESIEEAEARAEAAVETAAKDLQAVQDALAADLSKLDANIQLASDLHVEADAAIAAAKEAMENDITVDAEQDVAHDEVGSAVDDFLDAVGKLQQEGGGLNINDVLSSETVDLLANINSGAVSSANSDTTSVSSAEPDLSGMSDQIAQLQLMLQNGNNTIV